MMLPDVRRCLVLLLLACATLCAPSSLAAQQPLLAISLPDAPSALLANLNPEPGPDPQTITPYPGRAIVNGRPYHRPTRKEDFTAYRKEMFGTRPFLHAAIRAGIEQIKPNPIGWGQDFPGYAQRFGSAYGEAAIDSSVRFGLAAAFHEDVRYLICHHCSAGAKFANAALFEVTARHGEDGQRSFSFTPIVASLSGPLVAYAAWYPPGYDSTLALKHVPILVITRFVFNTIREFAFDRDTPAEKQAAKQTASK